MEAIISPIREDKAVRYLEKCIGDGLLPAHIYGGTRKCIPMLSCALNPDKVTLVITDSEARADKLFSDYRLYTRDVFQYPAKDVLFYSADVHGDAITRKRIEIIKKVLGGGGAVIIAPVDALMDRVPPRDTLTGNVISLRTGDVVSLDDLRLSLSNMGYESVSSVERRGQFSVRGGIIDIYPLSEEKPYRIELWDDIIDSIRIFDEASQRSVDTAEMCEVYPAGEFILTDEIRRRVISELEAEYKERCSSLREAFKTEEASRLSKAFGSIREQLTEYNSVSGLDSIISYIYKDTVSLLDYLPEDALIMVDQPKKTGLRAEQHFRNVTVSMENRYEGGYILAGQADIIYSPEEISGRINSLKTIVCSDFAESVPWLDIKASAEFVTKSMDPYKGDIKQLISDIESFRKEGRKILIVSPSSTRAKRLSQNLNDMDIPAFFSRSRQRVLKDREIMVTVGSLDEGFMVPGSGLIVISESDLSTGEKNKRSREKKYQGETISDISEIRPGDYVVHENYGIGIYKGIEKVEADGRQSDYITLQYGDGGELLIPVEQMEVIGKYASGDAERPKLNRLSGGDWQRTRERVRSEVDEMASELIKLYAARNEMEGFRFPPDSELQREFEEMFPYDETPDQLSAIRDIKRDMESGRIMDRLLCGDVGFGKTEVAIRAAFKCVDAGRQVVYLVPTTILADQHYQTFTERFKNYPVTIKLLSRFCTAKEIRETIEGLKNGQIDIVIGTHRLVSSDVNFKALGLLIIDEEQRFGVKTKERIKELKLNVDVLTLTATPIPRTLHMSLVGIRDMSLLRQPPAKRRPIQTYVLEYDIEFVKEAVGRELARGGQVYYVFNKIKDISRITDDLRSAIPGARIEFAHGRMNERELEDIMRRFTRHDIDVLVSTTIIETGLDISNVNTMIIHNAENFGLSQLYQLRGRVGRSDRRAYAFLMYKKDRIITEVAEKRLSAIREFTELGSGYKISLSDLEIRGSGNVLGKKQSGHMEAVGYDLYCRMLSDAVSDGMGRKRRAEFLTSVTLPLDAFIPDNYIMSEYIKLEMYKEIARAQSIEETSDIEDEARDRFGDPPKEFLRLLDIQKMKTIAHDIGISDIKFRDGSVQLIFTKDAPVIPENVPRFILERKGRVSLMTGKRAGFTFEVSSINQDEMLEKINSVIYDIKDNVIKSEEPDEESK